LSSRRTLRFAFVEVGFDVRELRKETDGANSQLSGDLLNLEFNLG
jgi:hypothetical protein